MSETTKRRLDHIGGALCMAHDGLIRLQVWSARCGAEPAPEPFEVWMTPGQAMDLVQSAAEAARKALKESL